MKQASCSAVQCSTVTATATVTVKATIVTVNQLAYVGQHFDTAWVQMLLSFLICRR
jgi:hypothetical protein